MGKTKTKHAQREESMILRDYQTRALEAATSAFHSGCRSLLYVGPTGMGKTVLGVATVLALGGRCLWLAHRQELIQQAADAIIRAGETPGIIAPWASPRDARIQVGSVQTLLTRKLRPEADIVVLDEAHHMVAEQWSQLASHYPNRIGLTATPERQDEVGLGNIFDKLIVVAQPKELIASGHLVPVRVLAPPTRNSKLAMDPGWAYVKHAGGCKAIVFMGTVAEAIDYAKRFNARDIPARAIIGEMDSEERVDAIDAFRNGDVKVLLSVYTLTEGFDVPDVGCAILARGFSSQASYIQAVGRAMRPAPGKSESLIIDLVGAAMEHGLPDEDRVFSLAGKGIERKEKSILIRQCPQCGLVSRPKDSVCPACKFAFPKKKARGIQKQELEHLDPAKLEEITREHVRVFLALQQQVRRLPHVRKQQGYVLGQFYQRFGCWPSSNVIKRAGGWYGLRKEAA